MTIFLKNSMYSFKQKNLQKQALAGNTLVRKRSTTYGRYVVVSMKAKLDNKYLLYSN